MSYIIILTTVPNEESAQKIADKLLSDNLAACVSFSTIFSQYKWNGKIEKESEIELQIKTKEKLYEQAATSIKTLHPHQVPQIIAIPIISGSKAYLEWIDKSLKADK